MDYNEIQTRILDVYDECHIKSLPFRCSDLLKHYGYRVFTYQALQHTNQRLYEYCCHLSDDAFHFKDAKIVAYNNTHTSTRSRFSLMHEFGHIILKHEGEHPYNEYEANYFASHILAPRMAVYYSGCRTKQDISNRFHISLAASEIVLQDFFNWYQEHQHHMSGLDWRMYYHFYNSDLGKFVFHSDYKHQKSIL